MTVRVCTITTRASFARARVMADSLLEHHPNARISMLVLDGAPEERSPGVSQELLTADDVLGEGWGLLAAVNPPAALALAALPGLIAYLLARDRSPVLYLGAGVRVLGELTALLAAQRAHEVVIVARPGSARELAGGSSRSGNAYSRQLLAVRPGPSLDALLGAWPSYFDPGPDQGVGALARFVDRLPALSRDVHVLLDPGYALDAESLASLSLEDGLLVRTEEGSVVPARIVDFAGLRPEEPSAWGGRDLQLSSSPALRELVELQARALRRAGWRPAGAAFGSLEDGLVLSATIRTLMREGVESGTLGVAPFSARGRRELYRHLNEPAKRGTAAGLTRLHLAIWHARADLREAYPHLDGPDGPGYAGWLCEHGESEEGLVAELLPPVPDLAYRDANPELHIRAPRVGVNVVGFFTSELGVGEVARQLIGALDEVSVPALPIRGSLVPPSRQGERFEYGALEDAAYPMNLLCINGDGIPVFAREAGRAFFEGRSTVAYWWWEVGAPPASWTPAYEFVDEIWVASRYVYDAIAPSSPRPVVKMTLPLAEPTAGTESRAELGLPEGFVFLFPYDYHSVYERKNPEAVIEAFARAFPPGSGARLVLKCINASTHPEQHERVMLAAGAHPDVIVLDGYLSGAAKNAMIARSDCVVSLHRSEGFGLGLAEAMLLGTPVIATGFGGNLEFMNEGNAWLVDQRLVSVGEGIFPYPPEGLWADPDLEHAAQLMRHVFERPDDARERAGRGRSELLAAHAPALAGAEMRTRLELLRSEMERGGARTLSTRRLPSALPARERPDSPGVRWGKGRLGRLRWRAERPLADWSREFIAHQSGVDDELRLDLARLDERIREVASALHERQSVAHAEVLAELRRLQGARGASDQPGERPPG